MKKWWHSSVVYQIYPKSFNDTNGNGVGDINGIIEKLDYLKELGIDVIWLSPVYKSPMKDNGYDISDYQDIAPEFGNLSDMENLIDEANKRGIKIVMDLVVNHTSDQHEWFKQAKKSKDNKYRDYYIWRDEPNDIGSIFGGSAWDFDESTKQYFFHLFAKEQPDLNWENKKVQEEVHNMINWWLDKGIGGFRMDVIDLIGKEVDKGITGNGERLHPLLQEMNKATFGNYDVMTVGETWGATPEIAKLYSNPNRNELSMIFQFEHISIDWHKDHGKWVVNELDFKKLKQILSKWQTELKGEGWNSLFWNNHDLPRIVSRWGNDKEYRVESAKMLATLLHGMQGTPYVYQGEEIGMTNVEFPSLEDYNDLETLNFYQEKVVEKKELTHEEYMLGVYKSGRDNARTPMQWDNSDNAGFTIGTPWLKLNPNYERINVSDSLNDKDSVFYHYKKLISLRKSSEYGDTIVYGNYTLLLEDDDQVFAYIREYDGKKILVIANFYQQETNISLDYDVKKVLISNYDDNTNLNDLKLRPYEAMFLEI